MIRTVAELEIFAVECQKILAEFRHYVWSGSQKLPPRLVDVIRLSEEKIMLDAALSWQPPFCSDDGPDDMVCPVCSAKGEIRIRAQDTYSEGGVEAYCSNCHIPLEVQASVNIEFSDPEVLDDY